MIKCAKGWKNSLGSLLDYSRIKMNICHLKQSRSLRFNKEYFLLRSHKWLHRELPVVVPDWLGSCVVHVIIRHPQSGVSWNLWSPLDEHLIDTLIFGHLIGISINTQSTSWSTVGQELTDFHRHVIVCPIHANESIHTRPTINSLSIKCRLR